MFSYGAAGGYIGYRCFFPVIMRAIPTTVVSGTWQATNCSATPIIDGTTTRSVGVLSQVTSLGNANFYANTSDDKITISAEL